MDMFQGNGTMSEWIRIVDWKLKRILINEVNMITYEWNRDDLKEKESEIE